MGVPSKFDVARADLSFEAGFSQPEFLMFRDTQALLHHIFKGLEPHGLRLADIRIERGAGGAADFHILCYLFNFRLTLRVRLDRVEAFCTELPQDLVERFGAAIVATAGALRNHWPNLAFRTHALALGLHGSPEGEPVRQYLSRFVGSIPSGLGPSAGSGVVMYFGPEGDRLLCSVTVDLSFVVPNALYVRTHVVWDGNKVQIEALPKLSESFVRQALSQIGLELPQ